MIFETDWINRNDQREIFYSFVDYIQINKKTLGFFNFYYKKISSGSRVKFGLDIQPGINFSYFVYSYKGRLDYSETLVKLKLEQKNLEVISENIQALILKSRINRTRPNKFLQLRFYKTRPSSTAIPMSKIILTGDKKDIYNTESETLELVVPEQLNFNYVRFIL